MNQATQSCGDPIEVIRCSRRQGSHVAAASVLEVVTRHATLVGRQKMPLSVLAAARIARINGWASRLQSHRLGRSASAVDTAPCAVCKLELALLPLATQWLIVSVPLL